MSTKEFWQECYERGIAIIPFMAYSDYDATGNYSDEQKLGIRFVALEVQYGSPVSADLKDFYLAIDYAVARTDLVADTPEGALELYTKAYPK